MGQFYNETTEKLPHTLTSTQQIPGLTLLLRAGQLFLAGFNADVLHVDTVKCYVLFMHSLLLERIGAASRSHTLTPQPVVSLSQEAWQARTCLPRLDGEVQRLAQVLLLRRRRPLLRLQLGLLRPHGRAGLGGQQVPVALGEGLSGRVQHGRAPPLRHIDLVPPRADCRGLAATAEASKHACRVSDSVGLAGAGRQDLRSVSGMCMPNRCGISVSCRCSPTGSRVIISKRTYNDRGAS